MTKEIFQRKMFSSTRIFAGVLGMFLITAGIGSAQKTQQISKEDRHMLETYVLSLDNLNKAIAAQKELQKLLAADPSIEKSMKQVPTESLGQRFKRMDSNPKIFGAIHSAGTTSKDFALTQACAANAFIIASMKKNGAPSEVADKMIAWKASAEQIAFVEAHPAEMKKYMQPLDAAE